MNKTICDHVEIMQKLKKNYVNIPNENILEYIIMNDDVDILELLCKLNNGFNQQLTCENLCMAIEHGAINCVKFILPIVRNKYYLMQIYDDTHYYDCSIKFNQLN
mgnify:CR=1 FL=1